MTDIEKLDDLIARLEKADGWDPSLEGDIVRAVFSPIPQEWFGLRRKPTASLDAAISLSRSLVGDEDTYNHMRDICDGHDNATDGEHLDRLPLKLCAITLRAYRASLQSKEAA